MENTVYSTDLQSQNQSGVLRRASCNITGPEDFASAAPTENPSTVMTRKFTLTSQPGLNTPATPPQKVDAWSKISIIAKYVLCIASLWLPRFYKYFLADSAWKADQDRSGSRAGNRGEPVVGNGRVVQVKWRKQTHNLITHWRMMQIMASGMIAAPIAFEQIQGVDNNVWTRTAVIMATVCAFASIMFSTAFIVGKSRMRGPKMADRWVQLSRQDRKFGALWFILALPLVWLLWSIILFLGAILVHVWIEILAPGAEQQLMRREEILPRTISVLSPLSVTVLLMVVVIQMLWILNMFVGLEGETEMGLDESSGTLIV